MANKHERLQSIWHRYEEDQEHLPTSTRQAIEWAVAERLLDLPNPDPYAILATEMAQALRDEYQTDHKGRRYPG